MLPDVTRVYNAIPMACAVPCMGTWSWNFEKGKLSAPFHFLPGPCCYSLSCNPSFIFSLPSPFNEIGRNRFQIITNGKNWDRVDFCQDLCSRTFPELFLLPEEFSRCWFLSALCPERLSFDRELEVDEVRGDRFFRPPLSCDDMLCIDKFKTPR